MGEDDVSPDDLEQRWARTLPTERWNDADPGATYQPPAQAGGPAHALPRIAVDESCARQEDDIRTVVSRGSEDERPTLPAAPAGELPTIIAARGSGDELPTAVPDHQTTVLPGEVPTRPGLAQPGLGVESTGVVYRLEEEIGRGGMGVVYRARQASLARDVAIKKVVEQDPYWRQRFVAEALVTGTLDHPNIVPVHDLGLTPEGEVFLAMKLVQGTSWKDLLHPKTEAQHARSAEYGLAEHVEILLGVCNAVAFAHSRGVVHRDLKPENVMLGEFGEVLVMDWGLAVDVCEPRRPSSSLPHKSSITGPCGTPAYMPPELAEGNGAAVGPGTDIYLLGAILCEVLRGSPPHRGKTFREVLVAAVLSHPPELPTGAPPELRAACAKAMALDPKDRYDAVADFQEALRAYLRHKESRQVAEGARAGLVKCRKRALEPLDELGRSTLYNDFAAAVAGFGQARVLWEGNAEAREGELEARLAFAEAALDHADLGLAWAQLSSVESPEARADSLRRRVREARAARVRAEQASRRLRWGLLAAVAVLFLVLGGGFLAVDLARRETAEQRDRARLAAERETKERRRADALREKSEQRLAESLVAEGDMLRGAGRWGEARARYTEAANTLRALASPTLTAELGLWAVQRAVPDELLRLDTAGACRALTLTPDGKLLATASEAGELALWDPARGRRIATVSVQDGGVTALAVSADGELFASGGADGRVWLWSDDGTPRGAIDAHTRPAPVLRFTTGGRLLTAGDSVLVAWPLHGEGETTRFVGHQAPITAATVDPFGPYIFSVDAAGQVMWWHRSGSVYWSYRERYEARVHALEFSPTRENLAFAMADRSVRLWGWDEQLNLFVEQARLEGHGAAVRDVAFSPDGRRLLSAGDDGRLLVWDVATRALVHQGRVRDGGAVLDLSIPLAGGPIAAGCADGARLFDLGLRWPSPSGAGVDREARGLPLPEDFVAHSGALSSDARLAAAGSADGKIRLWDTSAGREVLDLTGPSAAVAQLAFVREDRALLSAFADGSVWVWELAAGVCRERLVGGGALAAFALGPDGEKLALAGPDTLQLRGLPLQAGAEERHLVQARALGLGRHQLWALDAEGSLQRWSFLEGGPEVVGSYAGPCALAPGPQGLALGDARGVIHLLRSSGSPDVRLVGHTDRVLRLRVSADGRLLVSASADGTWRLWSVQEAAELFFAPFEPSTGALRDVALSPDGRCVLSVAEGGVRFWDIRRGALLPARRAEAHEAQARLQEAPDDGTALVTLGRWYAFRGALRAALELFAAAEQAGARPDPAARSASHWELGHFAAARRALPDSTTVPAVWHRLVAAALARSEADSASLLGREPDIVRDIAFSADGRRLLSCSGWYGITLWDAEQLRQLDTFPGLPDQVFALAFDHAGERFAAGDVNGNLRVQHLDGGARDFAAVMPDRIDAIAFLADGQRVLLAGLAKEARLVSLDSGAVLVRYTTEARLRGMAVTPDEERLVLADADGWLRVFALASGEELASWRADDRLEALALAGERLVTAGDGGIRLWSLGGEELGALPETYDGVYDLAAGGDALVTVHRGGEFRAWDLTTLTETGRWQRPVLHFHAAVSPDGRRFAIGSRDGSVLSGVLD